MHSGFGFVFSFSREQPPEMFLHVLYCSVSVLPFWMMGLPLKITIFSFKHLSLLPRIAFGSNFSREKSADGAKKRSVTKKKTAGRIDFIVPSNGPLNGCGVENNQRRTTTRLPEHSSTPLSIGNCFGAPTVRRTVIVPCLRVVTMGS